MSFYRTRRRNLNLTLNANLSSFVNRVLDQKPEIFHRRNWHFDVTLQSHSVKVLLPVKDVSINILTTSTSSLDVRVS